MTSTKNMLRLFAAMMIAISLGAGSFGAAVAQDAENGEDTAGSTIGDTSVGDSIVGDSSQSNSGQQNSDNDSGNDTGQTQGQEGGGQANAPSVDVNQSSGNLNEAEAGDGGDGGSGGEAGSAAEIVDQSDDDGNDNDGNQSVDTSTDTTVRILVDRLIVILSSILGDGNQSDNSVDTADDILPFSCFAEPIGKGGVAVRCDVDGAVDDCGISTGFELNNISSGDQFTCNVAGIDYACAATGDSDSGGVILRCTAEV